MDKTRVLFLCTENAARSQMAEAFLNSLAPNEYQAFSAGLKPSTVHPMTVQVMKEAGMDLEELGHTSKSLIEEFFDKQVYVGYLITVCSRAEKNCPIYPWAGNREFWDLEDPAAFQGTKEEELIKFRQIRDRIESRVREFVQKHSSR